ncbi:MAG: hypothetical protein AAB365_01960 [Patescibacteria group bacterium]
MTDICVLLRVGERPDENLRRILFTMAQYMFETEARYLPFEGSSKSEFTASMATDFKGGCQDGIRGTIFRAYIQYRDGRTTEATFLTDYREDWKELCVEKWEPIPAPDLGGDPEKNWKN